jgi:hypothetical protein
VDAIAAAAAELAAKPHFGWGWDFVGFIATTLAKSAETTGGRFPRPAIAISTLVPALAEKSPASAGYRVAIVCHGTRLPIPHVRLYGEFWRVSGRHAFVGASIRP